MLDSFSIYLIGFNIQLFRSNVDSFSIYLIDLTISYSEDHFQEKNQIYLKMYLEIEKFSVYVHDLEKVAVDFLGNAGSSEPTNTWMSMLTKSSPRRFLSP